MCATEDVGWGRAIEFMLALAFPYVRPVQKCVLSPFWTIGWWWVVESSPRRMNESGDSPPVPLKVVE